MPATATHDITTVQAEPRDQLGSRPTAALRTAGRLPVVIYGRKQDPVHLSIDRIEITNLLHDNAHLIEIAHGGSAEPCLIKAVQWNHLGNLIQHVDLTRVDLTQSVTVTVDIELFGDAIGLKEAGTLLEHPITQIEIECLPTQIPEKIRFDISELGVGESKAIADITLPEGIKAVSDPESVIAAIHVLAEEEEELEPTTDAAEPEVLGKKEEPEADAE